MITTMIIGTTSVKAQPNLKSSTLIFFFLYPQLGQILALLDIWLPHSLHFVNAINSYNHVDELNYITIFFT